MLMTFARDDDAPDRIYMTRHATVVSYFAESDDGSVVLVTEPGFVAYPTAYALAEPAVRRAALEEAARRLATTVENVVACSFADLKKVCDPELPRHYRYASRSRGRARP